MNIALISILLILSAVLGGSIVEILSQLQTNNKTRIIKLLLAFSGGFLLAIAFHHFLPELYEHHVPNIGIFVILGFIIQMLLEFFSGGIEHGHIHTHDHHLPYVMLISLSIHSVIEGIPLAIGLAEQEVLQDFSTNSYLLGIILHQIPVAIALMTLLKASHFNKLKSWVILLVFAIMTPLGTFIGYFFGDLFDEILLQSILAIVLGMFLHISTTIIFESSEKHQFNIIKLISILLGIGLAISMNIQH